MKTPASRLLFSLAFYLVTAAAMAQTTGTTGTTGATGGGGGGGGGGGAVGGGGAGTAVGGTRVGTGATGMTPFVGSAPANFASQATGGTTTTGTTGASATAIPGTANPFRATYFNPYAEGLSVSGSTAKKAAGKVFGQPVFGTATTTSTTTTSTNTSGSGTGFTTVGIRKVPSYVTALSEDFPVVAHAPQTLERDLRSVLSRSTALKSKSQMDVRVEGSVVILSGRAASEKERRLAESLLRFEPGVIVVENRLTLPGQP